MNAYDPAIFAASIGCLPCCPADACACALEIPPFDTAYASHAAAASAIAADVSDCFGFIDATGGYATFTADDSTPDEFDLDATGVTITPSDDLFMWASANMESGSTLTVTWSTTSDTLSGYAGLYSCSGTLIEESVLLGFPFGSGTYSFAPVSADGTYYVVVGFDSGGSVTTSGDWAYNLASDDTMTVNPVIALWDDSGTTRQLEACPKMLVPLLTESTGLWYASCADAETDLATDAVSNCVGICTTTITTFTATDGGSSLSFAVTSAPSASMDFWGSVNAESGETLSFAWTDYPNATANIYDYTGTLVETLTGSSSPLVSAALPYPGRYTVNVFIFVPPMGSPQTAGSATVTSSGTMTVNPIQALYDAGLGCPGRLDCGDSCP